MRLPGEGTLRGIATFVAAFGIGVATYIAIADSGGGSPSASAAATAARPSPTAPTRTSSASTSPSSASPATCSCSAPRCCAATAPGWRGFAVALAGFGYSVYLTYLELFMIDAICQWCVAAPC